MRVIVAEDSAVLRDGIVLVLRDHDIEVVGAVDNAVELLAGVDEHRPDLAVVDVRMPPTQTDEGVRAAIEIRRLHPETAVLVFSQWVETDYARKLLAEPEKIGYLLKDRIVTTDQFIDAARRVAAGGTALDPEVVRQLLARPADVGLARLTEREREVLARLAEGRSNQAIADELGLALRSVEKHVTSIFTKLDLPAATTDHRRVLAVLRYLNAGGAPG
jgi:DNA-binding NarL/FixJ family response regulator